MKLFKSRLDITNYIKESEEDFIENIEDMLWANRNLLFEIEDKLKEDGLSINKY